MRKLRQSSHGGLHYILHEIQFELLWVGFEDLCPYWDDKPWPADLASSGNSSSEESEGEASEEAMSSSSSENGDKSDQEMEVGIDGSETVPSANGLSVDELAASWQRVRSPRLSSMLASVTEAEFCSDFEIEVIREIIPENLIMEDATEFSFHFAGSP